IPARRGGVFRKTYLKVERGTAARGRGSSPRTREAPGPCPGGTTAAPQGARCTTVGANAGDGSAGPETETRRSGAPRGEGVVANDARRASQQPRLRRSRKLVCEARMLAAPRGAPLPLASRREGQPAPPGNRPAGALAKPGRGRAAGTKGAASMSRKFS